MHVLQLPIVIAEVVFSFTSEPGARMKNLAGDGWTSLGPNAKDRHTYRGLQVRAVSRLYFSCRA